MKGKPSSGYSPSPNLSLISANRAFMASSSRGPSHSSSTELPSPAASIITPMMLLAFTRRSLRLMNTWQGKLLASLVSLAEARACRPSLLLMVTVVLIMGGLDDLVVRAAGGDLHDPLRAPRDGAGDQGVKRLGRVVQGAPQHGHIRAGDDLHT